MARARVQKVPYRKIALTALVGTIGCVALTLSDYVSTQKDLGGLVAQSPTQRGAMLPTDELDGPPDAFGGGHDGRYFYAIARSFPNLADAAPYLDRPAYRSQRILFPMLGRALHPIGNGPGLIWTMFAIGVAGVLLSGFSTGCLSAILGGKTWVAAVPPLFYGSWVSLRITVPDPLAFGLGVSAVVLSMKRRYRWAIAAAIAAAFTRETAIVVLVGYALWKRDRRSALLAGVPIAAVATWAVILRLMHLPSTNGPEIVEFTVPLKGLYESAFKFWGRYEPLGAISLVPPLVLAVIALVRRGLHHPLSWMLVGELALIAVVSVDVLGPERNASRMALPILALAIVALLSPKPPEPADVGGPTGSIGSREATDAPLG